MTWIIGASALFGYGVLIADVQVTFNDGSTRDCLQKIYNLNNWYIAGFAGSVSIGFRMLDSLQNHLESTSFGDPISTINEWAPIASKLFLSQPNDEQSLQSHLLIVANSPAQNPKNIFENNIWMFRLISPHFIPGIMPKKLHICHIGSGSGIRFYKKSIRDRIKLGVHDPSLQAEMRGGEWGRQLAFALYHSINDHPAEGVSKHLQVMTIFRNQVTLSNNDMVIYPPNEKSIDFQMPNLATSYHSFESMMQSAKINPVLAKC